MLKTIEGRDYPSSKLTSARKKARPAIVHEIDRKILKIVQAGRDFFESAKVLRTLK